MRQADADVVEPGAHEQGPVAALPIHMRYSVAPRRTVQRVVYAMASP